MGFGYLLLGYLISHVLHLTVAGLGFGGAAQLVGYAVMYLGLRELTRYQDAFRWSSLLLLPLSLCGLYSTVAALDELFLWQLPLFAEATGNAVELAAFICTAVFDLALLYAIRMIAREVELSSMTVSAVRNMIVVMAHTILMLIGNLSKLIPESVISVLGLFAVLLNISRVILNLLLLLACNKNICRKGDEEVKPKPSRLKWINRMQDSYERKKQETADSNRAYAEELVRRRQERRKNRQNRRK